jgi:O-antigen ligase
VILGFFLTVIYITIIFLRPQEFIPAMRGWPILDFLAVFCTAAVFLEGGFEAAKFKRSTLNWLIVWFWLSLAVSHIANLWFGGAITAITEFAKVALVYFLVILTVDSFRRIRILLWVMLLMTVFLSFQAIVQFYSGVGLGGGEALQRGEVLQAQGIGIFGDPNDLALNMVTLIPFMLPAIHKPLLSRTSLTGVILLIPVVTGVILTRSRGGILGLSMVLWFYFYRRVGLLVSMGGLLLIFSILLTVPRMGEISAQESSARSRMEHWSAGLTMLASHPLFGVGMNRFTEYHSHTAHSSIILALAETGLFGTFFWVALFFTALREIYLTRRVPRAPPFLDPLLTGLVGSFIGWQCCALFLSHTYKFLSFVLIGLVVSVLNALQKEGITVRHYWGMRQFSWSLFWTGVSILFMHFALRILWTLDY